MASLNLGTIRKKEDPILKTQTNPIGYKEKMEEIKDGEKGAPSPSFQHYPKSGFLAEPPVDNKKEETSKDKGIPEAGSPIPEDLRDQDQKTGEAKDEDFWFGDEENSQGKDSPKDTAGKGKVHPD